ncbi:MAG: Uncharacterised protein [Flavobacteriia bacterium]|nr:MAG: Uncharacterised protein [Flavobacteriia bacterium]
MIGRTDGSSCIADQRRSRNEPGLSIQFPTVYRIPHSKAIKIFYVGRCRRGAERGEGQWTKPGRSAVARCRTVVLDVHVVAVIRHQTCNEQAVVGCIDQRSCSLSIARWAVFHIVAAAAAAPVDLSRHIEHARKQWECGVRTGRRGVRDHNGVVFHGSPDETATGVQGKCSPFPLHHTHPCVAQRSTCRSRERKRGRNRHIPRRNLRSPYALRCFKGSVLVPVDPGLSYTIIVATAGAKGDIKHITGPKA